MSKHDPIVIGSGQAGPLLAVCLAESGQKVALVDREHFGGTCANEGCIPTKTLVAGGRRAHVARRAADCGETQGVMKVLVDAQTERILDASLLCIEGDEIVHSLLDVMTADASYRMVQRAVPIHPTVGEPFPTLLGQLRPLPDAGDDAGAGAST